MTDVLLFNQYFTSRKTNPDVVLANMPINLLCLGSYLKFKGVKCRIYELGIFNPGDLKEINNRIRCGVSDEEIVSILLKESPKVIGIGCMYSRHYIDVLSIARLVKSVQPAIRVVVGGNHSTVFWKYVLKDHNIDFVVRGEGEISFFELCKNIIEQNSGFEKIKGIAYRKENGEIVKTPDRELIKNLNDLPQIDYSFVDIGKYSNPPHKSPFAMRYPAASIVTSRGCPNRCVYCTVHAVWGRTWRAKDIQMTVDEIELLHRRYSIREFNFMDDSASLDRKRWNGICDEIIKRKLDIRWNTPNGIAHWTLDKDTLRKMKLAGCYRVTFGIESGNPETRKFLGKPYLLSQAKEMIRYANRIGMWTICTNIIGFPYETKKSMDDTLHFAKKCGTDFATFYLLAPIMTSDVYECFKKEGLLDFDSIFTDNELDEDRYEEMNKLINDGGTPTKYFTSAQLKGFQVHYYRKFIINRALKYIMNPIHLLQKIRSVEDFRYAVRLVCTGVRLVFNSIYKKTTKSLLYE